MATPLGPPLVVTVTWPLGSLLGKKLYSVQVLTPSGLMSMVGPVGLEQLPPCQTTVMPAWAVEAKANVRIVLKGAIVQGGPG